MEIEFDIDGSESQAEDVVENQQLTEGVEDVVEVEETEPEAFEVPEHWTPEEREFVDNLRAQASEQFNPEDLINLWGQHRSNWDKGMSKKMQEQAEANKQVEALREQIQQRYSGYNELEQIITPYAQQWQARGMTPAQVIGQAVHWATEVQKDPVGALINFARQNNILSQLEEQIGNQGYTDPNTEAFQRQQQQLAQQIEYERQARLQQQQQYATNVVSSHMTALRAETDDSGNPKYPKIDDQEVFSGICDYLRALPPQQKQMAIDPSGAGFKQIIDKAYRYATFDSQPEPKAKEEQKKVERASSAARRPQSKKGGAPSGRKGDVFSDIADAVMKGAA